MIIGIKINKFHVVYCEILPLHQYSNTNSIKNYE